MPAALDKTVVVVALHVLLEAVVIVRVLLRPHREPASRIAWVAVIAVVPVAGMFAYLLFGEVSIGRRRPGPNRDDASAEPRSAR